MTRRAGPTNVLRMKALLSVVAALALLGCTNKEKDEAPPVAGLDAPSAPADPAACGNYAEQLCAEAGADSPTCAAIKTTTEIMPPAACAAGIAEIGYSKSKLAEGHKVCEELVAKLCGDLGKETETCKMVTGRSKEFGSDQCGEMMKEYPQVLAELQQMEKMNQPLDEAKTKLIADGDHPAFGPEDAKVTVVEFSDFECPYCSRSAEAVTQIKEKYSDKARLVFRQFPLSFHKNAHLAAQASIAAHKQGKFWKFHDLLFKNQKELGRDKLEAYAKDAGLDMTKFKAALDNSLYAKQVDDDMALGKTVFVQGTPTMFVNGVRVQDPTNFVAISAAIDGALAAAG